MRLPAPTRFKTLSLVAVFFVTACATIVYREVKLASKLKFSHKLHISEADCSDCHGDVAESKGATAGKFIGQGNHGGCADCHDEVEEENSCGLCHIGSDRKVRFHREDRGLKFAHATHDEKRVKGGCKTCHAKVYTATVPEEDAIPGHAVCKTCHAKAFDRLECTKCHRQLHRQKTKPMIAFKHDRDFIHRHGTLAQDTGRCAACHDQTYCADCHARTNAPGMTKSIRFPEKTQNGFIHRGDFLARHAVEARADSQTCTKCHGATHCTSCHELQGLSVPLPNTRIQAQRVHGPDIMQPGSPGFHGRLARRDIARCASCHDQGAASNCVSCHKVGALGGNPHPRRFRWRNKDSECRSNAMCSSCHIGGTGCP